MKQEMNVDSDQNFTKDVELGVRDTAGNWLMSTDDADSARRGHCMKRMTHRVFVYGTLKRDYTNNVLLRTAKFMGSAVTPPLFRMLEPSFPVLLFHEDALAGKSVAGELYHVDDATLASLDLFEGVASGMYTRETVEVVERGKCVQAYIYVGGPRWATSGCPAYTKTNAVGALDWQVRPVGARY